MADELIKVLKAKMEDGDLNTLFKSTEPTCRGATTIILSKLSEENVVALGTLGWGDFRGHSVAIVSIEEMEQKKVLRLDNDDLDNYIVIDGSFHQVSDTRENLFIGKLEDYLKIWRREGGKGDNVYTRNHLTISPVALADWTIDKNWRTNWSYVLRGGKKKTRSKKRKTRRRTKKKRRKPKRKTKRKRRKRKTRKKIKRKTRKKRSRR